MKNKYRSDLALAKNLGAAGSGSCHWLGQRISAIILVLFTWFLFSFSWELSAAGLSNLPAIIKKPCNIIMSIIFVLTSLYHGYLGIRVIIEDYIHCRGYRLVLLVLLQIFAIITAVSFMVAIVHIINL